MTATAEHTNQRRYGKLYERVKPFVASDHGASYRQLGNTFIPYGLLWFAMYQSLNLSYALTLALAVPTAGFTLRIWVLQHDLGHGSMFRSSRVNHFWGSICGVFTLLPYHHWRRIHNLHHSHFGNLDRRGPGYITTLTVREYLALPAWRRALYRAYRNPMIVVVPGAWYYFLLQHRVPYDARADWRRERRSVYFTNAAVLALAALLSGIVGWQAFLLVHLPIVLLASSVGAWIFVAQHSFEESYWTDAAHWDFVEAAVQGSSFYHMSPVMRWFTASVGYHHVHHLSPRIPNYRLAECHQEVPELRAVQPLTGRELWRTAQMGLWDEDAGRMVAFRDLKRRQTGETR
jgi:acyl-lipid omega-6 desaturase (Delta-12 desaturase)